MSPASVTMSDSESSALKNFNRRVVPLAHSTDRAHGESPIMIAGGA